MVGPRLNGSRYHILFSISVHRSMLDQWQPFDGHCPQPTNLFLSSHRSKRANTADVPLPRNKPFFISSALSLVSHLLHTAHTTCSAYQSPDRDCSLFRLLKIFPSLLFGGWVGAVLTIISCSLTSSSLSYLLILFGDFFIQRLELCLYKFDWEF